MYENGSLRQVTGGPLRPGGYQMSDRLLRLCHPTPGELLLDVGCGEGQTLAYIRENYELRTLGIDRSPVLLQSGRNAGVSPLTCASGEALPLPSNAVNIILSECSFSAMGFFEDLLREYHRVLQSGGKLALSDIYARDPQGAAAVRSLPFCSGLRNLLSGEQIFEFFQKSGFEIRVWEDHSQVLKTLNRKISGNQGAHSHFLTCAEPAVDPMDALITISRAKLGYYLLVTQKV